MVRKAVPSIVRPLRTTPPSLPWKELLPFLRQNSHHSSPHDGQDARSDGIAVERGFWTYWHCRRWCTAAKLVSIEPWLLQRRGGPWAVVSRASANRQPSRPGIPSLPLAWSNEGACLRCRSSHRHRTDAIVLRWWMAT